MNKTLKEEQEKRKHEVLSLTSKLLKILYIVLIVGIVLIATLLIKEWGILRFVLTVLKVASPLFVGFVIAWIFNPIVSKLNEKGIHRVLGSVIVYIVFLLILFVFISTLIPTMFKQLNELIKVIPSIITEAEEIINNVFVRIDEAAFFDAETIKTNLIDTIYNYGNGLTENLPATILSWVGTIFSGVGTVGISLIIGFYMLFDFDSITSHFLKLLPKKNRFEISHLLIQIGTELRKCVNGLLICAMLVFIVASIGFAIVGLEAPLLFGLFCGITDLIPYIGPFIGGAAAVVIGFSQGTVTGILTLLIVLIVQQLENLVIQPVVMSKSTKIHPVTIMIGLLVFGHFFGIVGMILATPLISLAKILFRFFVAKYDLFDYPEYELANEEKEN